jgi:hypothetical protein
MKRSVVILTLTLVFATGWTSSAAAQWGSSQNQPWHNIFAKRYKSLAPEEERLQKFWHDYYHALKDHYAKLDRIDWVQYYKERGYPINVNCPTCTPGNGCQRINYAPVFVSPTMQWAVPSSALPAGPAVPNTK